MAEKLSEQLEAAPEVGAAEEVRMEASEVELSPLQTATEAEEVLEAEERLFDSDEEAEISDRGCYRIMIIINIIAISPVRQKSQYAFCSKHNISRSCGSYGPRGRR